MRPNQSRFNSEAIDFRNGQLSILEKSAAIGLLALMAALRWFYASSHPWHSDEPQHMHVVWGWANGFLPYRDVFDNHSPSFSFLFSHIFPWFGVRADIITPMRLTMLPLFALSLWCLYRLGSKVFSRRAGLWGAVLAGAFPPWFLKMGEFRTDVLWVTLWLVLLVILISGSLTPWRLFFAGLVLGAAFSVSMKSTLFLVTIALAAGITWLVRSRFLRADPNRNPWLHSLISSGAFLFGLILVPGCWIGFFAVNHALEQMFYCIVQHNILPHTISLSHRLKQFISYKAAVFPIALAVAATTLPLFRTDLPRASRRMFFLLVVGLFYPLLQCIWPMITPQDYMPFYPVLVLAVTGFAVGLNYSMTRRWSYLPSYILPLIVVFAELAWTLRHSPLNARPAAAHIAEIGEVLRLTDPGEFVMDAKGDSIYRPRPYYWVLETLTRKRLEKGLLSDDLPQRLSDTHTAVVLAVSRMTEADQEFVSENYLSTGLVNVAGKYLVPSPTDRELYEFDVVIPQTYSIASDKNTETGILDGQPFVGARLLEAGHHQFHRSAGKGKIALVWARALERGFSPFHPRWD